MLEHGFMDISKLMHCGVYALLKKGEVVYVGKTKQPMQRIYRHVYNRGKPLGTTINSQSNAKCPTFNGKGITFDSVWFLPCMLGQLSVLEVHFIRMFMPKHNVAHNPEAKPRPERVPTVIIPIPDDIKALLAQMVTITGLPPMEDRPKVYIRRML